ncbi:T9SS type A sorting domain-containing protein [Lacinutrix sp. C3R15]|uniref:T9SS type A sorting domain-containing protein n=1 Tax=Flavobacteriaceae TaxID=49546 RepID=UPI001C08D90B|nr:MULTISPECIES: T9SS type A sorting domain-containing protein [Flavobacteriaceae]MBU2939819.1 T9SS type A sorting domain-containing protein [Lacinutrix sp. C3R15]MDO6623135.1 T9SS type A sorting domain-containing protein [Oceanihabitans sp. 1_MG-2023]
MKKQLLFTLALFATIFVASAQSNTFTFTGAAPDSQTFLFDAATYVLSGTDFSDNNSSFIAYNSEVVSGSPVSEAFGLNTSGITVNKTFTLRYRKRAANTGVLRISVPGQSDVTINLLDTSADDGNNNNALVDKTFTYPTEIPLSTAATNITVTLDEFTQNAASNARFRLYEVKLEATLSTNNIDVQATNITAYPNPVTNSFQINSNKNIESVKLYNITGRLLKTFNEETSYDISDLATGVYVANVKTASGSKAIRIVKK